ncbi:hypothetical protein BC936DRAFT_139021 [Jimgerdemannia flammicorona]|uniref:Domain of unknown function at the cortex 1 domain-containing protein n=1 Tax=Jimgerdemannia flammicorona TaxID=994334 RepID=A0A433BAW7_9FUNG|nr:hypothetical protein BC936DRAFT_139021 [Jimgerdemannia flammicorona]
MPTVRIGPDYDNLSPYAINDDANPLLIDSPHWAGRVTFRLNYARASTAGARNQLQTAYFAGRKRYFSIQSQGRFKPTNGESADGLWTGDDVLFVAETEGGIHPPPGAWLAVKFARFIDPGFTADGMYLEKRPWAGSWLLCGMNVVNVTKAPEANTMSAKEAGGESKRVDEKMDADEDEQQRVESPEIIPLGAWEHHGSNLLPESSALLFHDSSPPKLTPSQRRKYFHNPSNRRAVQFDPNNVYSFDFFNDFTNLATMKAEMGLHFDIRGVLNRQPLRFVCTSKDRKAVFFVMEIDYADLNG